MTKKPKIVRVCENCGKPQPILEEKSNENWKAYNPNLRCECGGKFMFKQSN